MKFNDPRTEFGKALTQTEAGDGNLHLTRWRDGAATGVVVKLPVLGGYSATAPLVSSTRFGDPLQ